MDLSMEIHDRRNGRMSQKELGELPGNIFSIIHRVVHNFIIQHKKRPIRIVMNSLGYDILLKRLNRVYPNRENVDETGTIMYFGNMLVEEDDNNYSGKGIITVKCY